MAVATDDFNRGALGANWSAITGQAVMVIAGSVNLQPSNYTADSAVRYNALTPSNDQYAQCKVSNVGVNPTCGLGPAIRVSAAANTFYRVVVDGGGNYEVSKFLAGAFTSLRAGTVTYVSGAVVYLSANGTTLTFKYNGVQVGATITDPDITSGYGGVSYSGNSVTGAADDFEVGDLLNNYTLVAVQASFLLTAGSVNFIGPPGRAAAGVFDPQLAIKGWF